MQMTCTVCSSGEIKPAFMSAGYEMARCASCEHLFVSQPIEAGILDDAYLENYYATGGDSCAGYTDYLANAARRTDGFRSRLRDIVRFSGGKGDILDFGCAVGLFVRVAKDEGWRAVGYERSRWAAEYGRRELEVDIRVSSDGSNPFTDASFDVITLWDVIEHVEHPQSVMALVRMWLRAGGIVALNTINASSLGARLAGRKWRHLAPPHHLQFFSRRSLMRLLHDTGFRIVHVGANGTCFDGTGGSATNPMLRRMERIVCHWRLRPFVSELNLLDEIEVIAVKT